MRLSYVASLPERVVRAAAATIGGTVYQTSEVLLPTWFRRSHLYQATIARMLRITIEMVGDVSGALPPDGVPIQTLAVRKAAGNVVELASFLAVGWSPLWLLAAAADITGGTRTYLRTLVEELKRDGVLPQHADATSFEDLMNSLERTSGLLADTMDVPPLNVHDARASWQAMRQHASELPDAEGLATIFARLQKAAELGGQPLRSVAALLAAGAVRAGIRLGNTYVFEYYQEALGTIIREGLPVYAQRVARPYLAAAVHHFDPAALTYTQRLLGTLRRWWQQLRPGASQP